MFPPPSKKKKGKKNKHLSFRKEGSPLIFRFFQNATYSRTLSAILHFEQKSTVWGRQISPKTFLITDGLG